MSKLQEIMNDVAKEQYDCSWVYACTFMHASDVENLMKKVARRYATAVAADALKRAADTATVWVETPINGTEFESVTKELGDGFNETITVFKDRILSTPINTDL